MARWDEILTLPVQNPPTLEFSAADIIWSRVEGWRETMDRLALIPFTRVNDFVRGESNNKECPTRFHVEARRRRPPETTCKPKVDGILEYILYWCSFGPDDHRKGGVVRPSRNYTAKRKTPAGRPNTKRGCVCHFIVKRLIADPSVALIIYNKDKHVDKKGLPCHGPQDKKAAGTKAMFAPYISDELRLQVMSLLYVGVPVETIMQRHSEAVEKQGGPCNRDDLLTHRYVRRLERKIRRSTYELDPDDAVSIGLWIESHQDHVFYYKDFSDSEPFVLGIQTEWQLQQLIRFGNHSILAADSRFGTNKLKYPIYSLLVFDSNNNAIPVAWIMTPDFANSAIHRWMGALYDRVRSKDPTWKLGGFIIDDPSTDVLTIREIFQCSVLISFWRVRHAWHKHLMKRCPESEIRAEISRRLGEIVTNICRENVDMDSFEVFMEDFVDCSDFLDYFMAIWYPRLGMWITALKALPFASVEVSAAIECYHTQLKLRLLNEEDPSIYQRADWLVDKLGTKVHSYYWLDEYAGKENFARYWKDEWKSGLSSFKMASQILDSDVVVDAKRAKVVSDGDGQEQCTILNPGSEFAVCDCNSSQMGNLCKHVIKSSKVCRDKGLASASTSLSEYTHTLMNILNCPPNDSIIRDHAVALAVSVQSQLSELFDLRDTGVTSSALPTKKPTDAAGLAVTGIHYSDNPDEDLMNETQSVSENQNEIFIIDESPSGTENNDVSGETANCGVIDDITFPTDVSLTDEFSAEQLSSNNDVVVGPNSDTGEELKTISEGMMGIDPQLIRCSSSSRFEDTNGGAGEGHASRLSEIRKMKFSDVSGHPCNSVGINVVEANGHNIPEKEQISETFSSGDCEKIVLDQNNVGIHDKICDILVNGSSAGNTIVTTPANHVCSSNDDLRDPQMDLEHCSGKCTDTVGYSLDAGNQAGTDHMMDVAIAKEGGDNIMENEGDSPLEVAPEVFDHTSMKLQADASDNMQLDHDLRGENRPSAEAKFDGRDSDTSVLMDEDCDGRDLPGITKDSLGTAFDAPPDNGVA